MAKLQRFDAFIKVQRNVQNLTASGGIITIFVSVLLLYLSLTEWISYLTPNQKYEFLVDTFRSTHHSLQLNVDLTVAMHCDYVRADVVDGSGESMALEHVFTKELVNEFHVMDAHKLHEVLQESAFENIQVKKTIKEASKKLTDAPIDHADGVKTHACRIRGNTQVNKVAGMLHMTAAGHGYWGQHTPHNAMNGQMEASVVGYPLMIDFDAFKYYVSIVPTIYVDRNKGANPFIYLPLVSSLFSPVETVLLTNQYAVTEYKQPAVKTPGIFIKYDMEPVSVRITEEKGSRFLHFIVRLCGIVGGVFVTMGMIHSFIRSLWFLVVGKADNQATYSTPLQSPIAQGIQFSTNESAPFLQVPNEWSSPPSSPTYETARSSYSQPVFVNKKD